MWLVEIARAVGSAVLGIVRLFPVADLSPLNAAAAATVEAFKFGRTLNAHIPFVEGLAMIGLYLSVYVALHGANLLRRVVSLLTGGGGA